jgi:hypothetical protein
MGFVKFGKDGVLTIGGAVAKFVRDVTIKTDPIKSDTSSRDSIMDTEETVGIKVSIDFEMLNRTDSTVLTSLLTAASTGAALVISTSDGGGHGWTGSFEVSAENGQPYRGEQTYKFTATASSKNATYPTYA